MIINNKMENVGKVPFGSLKIGDTYIDDEGVVCIKISHSPDDYDDFAECLYFSPLENEWVVGEEANNRMVLPVKATLTIEPMDK